MLWYAADDVEGRADHWVELYRNVERTPDGDIRRIYNDTSPCPGIIGEPTSAMLRPSASDIGGW